MAVLKIRDAEGNMVPVPCLKGDKGDPGEPGDPGIPGQPGEKGDPGKSAYQYAQDGGFTGTEEEFAAKLAIDTYSKTEIDAKLNTYIDEVAALIGGDA